MAAGGVLVFLSVIALPTLGGQSFLTYLVLSIAFLALGWILARGCGQDRHWGWNVYLVAYTIRLLSTLVVYSYLNETTGVPYFSNDDSAYSLVPAGETGYWLVDSIFRNPGYPILIQALYRFFGRDVLVARLFNAWFGAIQIFLVYRLALYMFEPRIARIAALVVALHPLLIFYSSLTYKDTLLGLFLLLYLDGAFDLTSNRSLRSSTSVVKIVVASIGIALARIDLASILVLLLAIHLVWNGRVKAALVVGMVIFLGLFIGRAWLSDSGSSRLMLPTTDGVMVNREIMMERVIDLSEARLSQYIYVLGDTPLGIILQAAALSVLMFVSLQPNPNGPLSIVTVPYNFGWYSLLPLVLFGLISLVRTRPRTSAILWIVWVAVPIMAAGTLLMNPRYRVQVMPIDAILVALAISTMGRSKRFLYKLLVVMEVTLVCVYWVI